MKVSQFRATTAFEPVPTMENSFKKSIGVEIFYSAKVLKS